ncbi:putative DNA-binding protein [Bacillaceae bacterium SIJ1]|uniref:putative DNA-binding protein n=1 Tax=Litoribacterium kuwaitense TaxID=1398745 RepID=UPI0013ED7B79|nr:putative DNA-binding protein [Litoribacterium kuwaitense]NGP44153.1 putative DNA-binding protein [Litoribacterium kuwaitense]
MIDKTNRMTSLFDFYAPLLTEKQHAYMNLYYCEDYSLGEIAENFEVSRQAVYDNIRRTEALLEDYESKLHLLERFHKRDQLLDTLKSTLMKQGVEDDALQLLEEIERLD